jgi:hypothetical protein
MCRILLCSQCLEECQGILQPAHIRLNEPLHKNSNSLFYDPNNPLMIHIHTQWRHHKPLTIMERRIIKYQQLATEQVKRQLKVRWHTLEMDSFTSFFSSHFLNFNYDLFCEMYLAPLVLCSDNILKDIILNTCFTWKI